MFLCTVKIFLFVPLWLMLCIAKKKPHVALQIETRVYSHASCPTEHFESWAVVQWAFSSFTLPGKDQVVNLSD